jgi:hypothetical protein
LLLRHLIMLHQSGAGRARGFKRWLGRCVFSSPKILHLELSLFRGEWNTESPRDLIINGAKTMEPPFANRFGRTIEAIAYLIEVPATVISKTVLWQPIS